MASRKTAEQTVSSARYNGKARVVAIGSSGWNIDAHVALGRRSFLLSQQEMRQQLDKHRKQVGKALLTYSGRAPPTQCTGIG